MKNTSRRKFYAQVNNRCYRFTKPCARHNRKAPTDAEAYLWQHLRTRKMEGYKFRRQHPIGPYIADFICLSAKLIIEVDGGIHFTDDHQKHDAHRTADLQQLGFRVIRFTNEEVLFSINIVLSSIAKQLAGCPK